MSLHRSWFVPTSAVHQRGTSIAAPRLSRHRPRQGFVSWSTALHAAWFCCAARWSLLPRGRVSRASASCAVDACSVSGCCKCLVERLLLLENSGGCKRKTRVIEKQCKRALLRAQRTVQRRFLSVLPSMLRPASSRSTRQREVFIAAGQEKIVEAQVLASRRGRATFPNHHTAPVGPEAVSYTHLTLPTILLV